MSILIFKIAEFKRVSDLLESNEVDLILNITKVVVVMMFCNLHKMLSF